MSHIPTRVQKKKYSFFFVLNTQTINDSRLNSPISGSNSRNFAGNQFHRRYPANNDQTEHKTPSKNHETRCRKIRTKQSIKQSATILKKIK